MHPEESIQLQNDLFSEVSDLDLMQTLLAEMHDELPDRIHRFRYLSDLGRELGSRGTMIFGGAAAYNAWCEARSSFVYGNFVGVVLLCQSLVENLLAAFLSEGLMADDLPPRIAFRDTLARCKSRGLVNDQDCEDLERLMSMRNPLSHFRGMQDPQNLDRRAMTTGAHSDDLLRNDAWFAIGLAIRMLGKPPFRLG